MFQWVGLVYFLVVRVKWFELVAGIELMFFFPLGCGWERVSNCELDCVCCY